MLFDCSLSFWGAGDEWTGGGVLNWQGALLLLRSVKAKEKAGVNHLIEVCSESEMLVRVS